ncbi:MAG: MerR family transcriptional regulator [Halothiobacillaceae bacterium]
MRARKRPEETDELPAIPGKRYFTIGEASELCAVKPHVLRYWEQEFPKLNPVKRRGNRRYYQREDIELIRRIRTLLYDQGFTISGARQQLDAIDSEGPSPAPGSLRDIILRVESVLTLLREGLQHKD